MKPFAISKCHLTLSEVPMKERDQRTLQARKKSRRSSLGRGLIRCTLHELQARVYDCITFPNCMLFHVLALGKNGSGKTKICLKYKIGTTASPGR